MVQEGKPVFYFVLPIAIVRTFFFFFFLASESGVEVGTYVLKNEGLVL